MKTINYSHILWDFNGTILNDVEAGIKSANVLLSRRSLKTLESVEDYHRHFCFPVTEYYRRIGLDFNREPFSVLAEEWMEQYLLFSRESVAFPEIKEVVSEIKRLGIPQIILSASEKNILADQLAQLDLSSCFDEILGLDHIRADSKVHLAQEWMGRACPKHPVLVGDTVHDFEVAKAAGISCVLIARGHQNKDALMECGVPVYEGVQEWFGKEVKPR